MGRRFWPTVWDELTGRGEQRRLVDQIVQQTREEIAAEIEAYRGPVPWQLPRQAGANDSWIDSRDCALAARIARGETS